MSVLITEVKILDPNSPFHNKKVNVFIKDGIINALGSTKSRADQTIDGKGAVLTPGWLDLQANFADPGDEQKEDLRSGRKVAEAGGFTEVVVLPNTNPPIQTKNDIEYIKRDNKNCLVQLLPVGAISKGLKGEDFTELHDLYDAGAVAFSDGLQPLWNTDLLRKSIMYVQKFNGLVIDRPEDHWLAQFGVMNESVNSTLVGMKGIPNLAEEIIVDRDLKLLDYTGGKLHLANISTSKSVSLIRRAKKKGLQVTCDVALHQLLFTDEKILDFEANYKVSPPLRSQKDINALIKGLKEGTIDAIVSAHQPQDEENKKLEFDQAADGMNNMQVVGHMINELKTVLPLDLLMSKLTSGPRQILGRAHPVINKGEAANLTLYKPAEKWQFDRNSNRSKSENSPYFGKELTGKVIAVFNNGQFVKN